MLYVFSSWIINESEIVYLIFFIVFQLLSVLIRFSSLELTTQFNIFYQFGYLVFYVSYTLDDKE